MARIPLVYVFWGSGVVSRWCLRQANDVVISKRNVFSKYRAYKIFLCVMVNRTYLSYILKVLARTCVDDFPTHALHARIFNGSSGRVFCSRTFETHYIFQGLDACSGWLYIDSKI